MALTDTKIKALKGGVKPDGTATGKPYKVADGKGLYLEVHTNGAKYWRMKYRVAGKEKRLSIGVYPDTPLARARQAATEARGQLAQGVDPSEAKRQASQRERHDVESRFSVLAREWWDRQRGTWKQDHAARVWRRIEVDVLPFIGDLPAEEITPRQIMEITGKIEDREALDVVRRVLADIRRILTYGVIKGRITSNPALHLTGQLKARKTQHRDSLPKEELPEFLRELDGYHRQGRLLTQYAIKLLVLTFVRSGELRGATWEEFDTTTAVWRIPGERMKMKEPHLVPLSRQALDTVEAIRAITGGEALLFPSERDRDQPMSDNTMRRAIFKLGYDGNTPGKSKAVPHGFRATASSILNEENFNPDAIERQLSHQERNGVRAAYTHHARYLEERAVMMQWWADYLDKLKAGAEVVPFRSASR